MTFIQDFAKGGAGAIIIEATAVVPEGRITPEDAVCSSYYQCWILSNGSLGLVAGQPNCSIKAYRRLLSYARD
jgi:hypothetical protein